MDNLANLRWEVPENLDRIHKGLETLYLSAIDVLRNH
jgi:hypothetical protein